MLNPGSASRMARASCAGVKASAPTLYVQRVSASAGAAMRRHVASRQSGMCIMGSAVSGA